MKYNVLLIMIYVNMYGTKTRFLEELPITIYNLCVEITP